MDFRRKTLISWQAGFDIRDYLGPAFRRIAARIARKRDNRQAAREIAAQQAEWADPFAGEDHEPFYEQYDHGPELD